MKRTPKLLCCPFCGGKGTIMTEKMMNLPDSISDNLWVTGIICENVISCSASTYTVLNNKNSSRKLAIGKWNQRITNPV
jgi:hypothetical protein